MESEMTWTVQTVYNDALVTKMHWLQRCTLMLV